MRPRLTLCFALLVGCASKPSEPIGRVSERLIEPVGAMTFGRALTPCGLLGTGEVIYFGADIPGGYLSSAEIFDPATKRWKETAPFPSLTGDSAAITLPSGVLMVHGGYGNGPLDRNEPNDITMMFDPIKRAWSKVASSKLVRAQHTLTRLLDGRILAAGGYEQYELDPSSTAELYDPAKNTWSPAPSMAFRHTDHAAIAMADGRVFLAGQPSTGAAEIFSPAGAMSWTSTLELATARRSPALGLLTRGRVIVIGGIDESDKALSTTEIWDPTTNAFTAGPNLAGPHGLSVTAVPLASGALLVAGGRGDDGKLERLDPEGIAFVSAGKLDAMRVSACIIGIAGGALIAGGGDPGPQLTAVVYRGAAGDSSCKSGDECASGVCTGGKCSAAPKPDAGPAEAGPDIGSPQPVTGQISRCSKDSECSTGHCSDGVCCDTACTDLCHSCALPATVGTCSSEPLGVDLRGECGVALSCSATCNGGGACVGATTGTQCAAAKCTSAQSGVGPATCVAAGARCPTDAVVAFECAPFACEPIFGACRASCAASSDCAGGFVCDIDAKTCIAPAPSEDAGGCTTSHSPSTRIGHFPWLFLLAAASRARRARAERLL